MSLFAAGNALDIDKLNGVYTSYTPTWSSSGTPPSLGNGAIAGRWWRNGQTVHFRIRLIPGLTTTFGTGQWTFTLPIAAEAVNSLSLSGGGVAIDLSAGTTAYPLLINGQLLNSTTAFGIWDVTHAISNVVVATSPFTWATGDTLEIGGSYFAA